MSWAVKYRGHYLTKKGIKAITEVYLNPENITHNLEDAAIFKSLSDAEKAIGDHNLSVYDPVPVPFDLKEKAKTGGAVLAEEIIKHNQSIRADVKALEAQIERRKEKIIPPCEFCPYDGVYRCETCAEEYYAGYNIKNYP